MTSVKTLSFSVFQINRLLSLTRKDSPMTTLLVKNIDVLATMDAARREIPDGAILVEDNVIQRVGTTAELTADPALKPDRTIDARGTVVIPGLINTHHHLYQNLVM